MARGLSAAILTEIAKQGLQVAFLVEVNVSSGPVRVWSGYGPLTWNSVTWTGVGDLGKIGQMPETADVQAQGCSLQLSGISSSMLGYALTQIRQGLTATICLALLDSTGAIIDVAISYSGRVDSCTINEGADTSTITINVENELITLQRPRERHYTPDDQKAVYSDDLGFDWVPAIQELNLVWGQAQVRIPTAGTAPPVAGSPGGPGNSGQNPPSGTNLPSGWGYSGGAG
jgi:hypothetical protein